MTDVVGLAGTVVIGDPNEPNTTADLLSFGSDYNVDATVEVFGSIRQFQANNFGGSIHTHGHLYPFDSLAAIDISGGYGGGNWTGSMTFDGGTQGKAVINVFRNIAAVVDPNDPVDPNSNLLGTLEFGADAECDIFIGDVADPSLDAHLRGAIIVNGTLSGRCFVEDDISGQVIVDTLASRCSVQNNISGQLRLAI